MSARDEAEVDVLIIAKSGVGHFHPVAAFVERLAPAARVVFAAELRPDHPVRRKIEQDGARLAEWQLPTEHGTSDRLLMMIRRFIVRRVTPRLARRGEPTDPLPRLAARMTFSLASLLRPIDECRPSRGVELHRLLTELQPSIVFTEGFDEWMSVLSAHHSVPWLRYTTGPVAELSHHRPTEPAGLDPDLRGAEGAANVVLLGLRRLRGRIGARRVHRAASQLGMSGRTDPPTACIAFAAASLDDHASTPAAWRYVGLSPYHPPQRWWSEEDPPERDTVLVTWGSGRVGGERELLGQLIPVLIELSHDLRIVVQSADSEVREMVEVQFSGEGRVETQTPNRDPQYDLYRRARLVIGHGGYGTINEALAFGAPVLVLPELVADRMETARRVHRAGVGASLNRYTATTSSLRTTVHRILAEPAIQCAVEHVGADLRDRSPSEQVLDQLRTFLR